MTRTISAKQDAIDDAILDSAARVRARVLAVLHGGLKFTGLNQTELASRLGVRKSAASQVFNGRGNITVDTLSEYLGAMGLEADLVVTVLGETELAMLDQRVPRWLPLTETDLERLHVDHANFNSWVVQVKMHVDSDSSAALAVVRGKSSNSNDAGRAILVGPAE